MVIIPPAHLFCTYLFLIRSRLFIESRDKYGNLMISAPAGLLSDSEDGPKYLISSYLSENASLKF